MKRLVALVIGLVIGYGMFANAVAEKVYLTSLDWPPYTGKKLTQQGASVAVAKAVFKAAGYDLIVEFFPWKRAVDLAKDDPKYAGYFPEYFAAELEQDFIFSEPMGSGPLGFAELKSAAVAWQTLHDLKEVKIGTVSGYVNTAEFDQMAAKGELRVDAAGSDTTNLLKLNGGRISLAVIDKNVMHYLLSTEKKLVKAKNNIQFNNKMLEDKKLYICFKKNDKGKMLVNAFNKALTEVDVQKIMNKYFSDEM
ncbi:substrate-binding periplasmic protein [Spartinivicinus poritis]|uniref:ABC transporter substrate-binding protein n=1 Tax=Spartinivicinus poritis TaxID=2994640 RepID=A0ABT5U2J3_9GAMM|nr:ABC transporter substrate-binding protein [Spartinivicinus sp. A2-2]MDE1460583.1 ABC transporter substrate-binding protein [Spartinivicinus sp. A2-2]